MTERRGTCSSRAMLDKFLDDIRALVRNRFTGTLNFKIAFREGGIRSVTKQVEEQLKFKGPVS